MTVSCGPIFSKGKSGKHMAGSSRSYREPGRVRKAKKIQEARERRNKKNYAKSIENSRKRSIEMQSPDVQARMKQNDTNIALRDKEKAKRSKAASKKTGKKYK